MSNETQLRDMKGLGPKSCEMLTEALEILRPSSAASNISISPDS